MQIQDMKELGHRKILIHYLTGSFWRILIVFFGASMFVDSLARTISDKRATWPEAVVQLAAEAQDAWEASVNEDYEEKISTLQGQLRKSELQVKQVDSARNELEKQLLSQPVSVSKQLTSQASETP